MQKFLYFPGDGQPQSPPLAGAHLLGADAVPVRGEIEWHEGLICCAPRTQDPVGLSLLWTAEGCGTVQLSTTRLPPRERPYHLHIELARHLLMRISVKREEWGLYDYSGMDDIAAQISAARDAFIAALQASDDPPRAAKLADRALTLGLEAGERMTAFHAGVFIARRQQSGGFAQAFLGIALPSGLKNPKLAKLLPGTFDFARVPMVWREIQPTEHEFQFDPLETTLQTCAAQKLPVRGGPLLNFGVRSVPDWMYIWENDFESIYDAAREHIQRVVQRYAKQVTSWLVVSGIHADSAFGFSFEQIMELTRMAVSVTRQVAPRSQVIVDLSQPWGEYYARNQQTIPPLLYADMAVQSGIPFDGFGLQLLFGLGSDGYHLRDPLQISAQIDKLANLGKPLHITALGAPSETSNGTDAGGQWRAPWSEQSQADWIEALCEIALSKPYVESVCLMPFVDGEEHIIVHGGVLRSDFSPKPLLARLKELRRRFQTSGSS